MAVTSTMGGTMRNCHTATGVFSFWSPLSACRASTYGYAFGNELIPLA